MTEFETIKVDTMTVGCDGGGGGLGHPTVYLNLAPAGSIVCPYCSRHYVFEAEAHPPGAAAHA